MIWRQHQRKCTSKHDKYFKCDFLLFFHKSLLLLPNKQQEIHCFLQLRIFRFHKIGCSTCWWVLLVVMVLLEMVGPSHLQNRQASRISNIFIYPHYDCCDQGVAVGDAIGPPLSCQMTHQCASVWLREGLDFLFFRRYTTENGGKTKTHRELLVI